MPSDPMGAELLMLGTGSAFPRHSYNSCFVVKTERLLWLTDAGGGNGIFSVLEKAGVAIADIHHLFVTHAHTDHILGAVWVLRGIVNLLRQHRYEGSINLYADSVTASALLAICRLTFLESDYGRLESRLVLHEVAHGQKEIVEDVEITFFNTGSENVMQTGYSMLLPSGTTFATLGDEALSERNAPFVNGADYLLCGAFCCYADREVFKPYEKHHLTVKDVAMAAQTADIGTLIISHSEDVTPDKTTRYTDEAAECFGGKVLVPADGDRIPLS